MSLRKPYFRPKIEVVSIDVDISVCMNSTTDDNQPDPGVHPGAPGASSFESTQVDDSGIKENPFR